MIDLDPAILSGYVLALISLVFGLLYSIYKARRG